VKNQMVGPKERMMSELLETVQRRSLARAIDEDKEKPERKLTPREWAKWAGYDCGE